MLLQPSVQDLQDLHAATSIPGFQIGNVLFYIRSQIGHMPLLTVQTKQSSSYVNTLGQFLLRESDCAMAVFTQVWNPSQQNASV